MYVRTLALTQLSRLPNSGKSYEVYLRIKHENWLEVRVQGPTGLQLLSVYINNRRAWRKIVLGSIGVMPTPDGKHLCVFKSGGRQIFLSTDTGLPGTPNSLWM